MKKLLFITFLMVVGMSMRVFAQNAAQARKVLDRTAALVGRKGGASANFSISSPKIGKTSGSIAIKGSMFYAHTPKATVWYNGKTQWTLMKQTNEVNVTTPTEAQRMRMNPYTFITMYKKGYKLGMTKKGGNYVIHLTATNRQRSVSEMYLTVNSRTSQPSVVKMREGNTWSTITISNFRARNLPNSMFTFRAKDFPKAEVIDLR
jgi:outer membrane lipoprotein-sorting protein